MNTTLYFNKTSFLKKIFHLFLFKIINTNPIMFHIEIIFQLSISLIRHIDLPKIISAIISKKKAWARLHPFGNFDNNLLMLFRNYSGKYKNHWKQIWLDLKRNFIFNEIANLYINSLFVLWMVLHLFFNEFDGLSRNIASLKIEKVIFAKQWKQSVSNPTA